MDAGGLLGTPQNICFYYFFYYYLANQAHVILEPQPSFIIMPFYKDISNYNRFKKLADSDNETPWIQVCKSCYYDNHFMLWVRNRAQGLPGLEPTIFGPRV